MKMYFEDESFPSHRFRKKLSISAYEYLPLDCICRRKRNWVYAKWEKSSSEGYRSEEGTVPGRIIGIVHKTENARLEIARLEARTLWGPGSCRSLWWDDHIAEERQDQHQKKIWCQTVTNLHARDAARYPISTICRLFGTSSRLISNMMIIEHLRVLRVKRLLLSMCVQSELLIQASEGEVVWCTEWNGATGRVGDGYVLQADWRKQPQDRQSAVSRAPRIPPRAADLPESDWRIHPYGTESAGWRRHHLHRGVEWRQILLCLSVAYTGRLYEGNHIGWSAGPGPHPPFIYGGPQNGPQTKNWMCVDKSSIRLIHHSDRGVQHSRNYVKLLQDWGISIQRIESGNPEG